MRTRWKIRVGVVFVGPFDEIVVDVISGDDRAHVRIGENHAPQPRPVGHLVAVEPAIADDQVAGAVQYAGMQKGTMTLVVSLRLSVMSGRRCPMVATTCIVS